jgi:hypothetical protein
MGTYTASQYKAWTRLKLVDSSFDDPTLMMFLGDVNSEICNTIRWPFMESTFVGTIGTGFNTYAQPSDLQQVLQMEVTTPTNRIVYLDYIPYEEHTQRYPAPATLTVAQPSIWTAFAGNFIVGPSYPDQTYTLNESYIKVPSVPSGDSSTIDVPDSFRELVVLGMYARSLESVDQPDYAIAQYNKFEKHLNLMKQRYGTRQAGTPLKIQTRRTLLRGR